MQRIVLLTDRPLHEVLPAALPTGPDLKSLPPSPAVVAELADLGPDLVIVDGVPDPHRAHEILTGLVAARSAVGAVVVVGRADVDRFPWARVADDFVYPEVSAPELELRMAMIRARRGEAGDAVIRLGAVAINVDSYQVSVGGRPLDLTFKEFELLRHLAGNAGRAFTRARLLQDVWGYNFYGGTRTVDVHIRRLRAKLGPQHEHLIETVRGVGYRASDVTRNLPN